MIVSKINFINETTLEFAKDFISCCDDMTILSSNYNGFEYELTLLVENLRDIINILKFVTDALENCNNYE